VPGVGIYNYQKLKGIRAKASLSTTKDSEKGNMNGGSILSAANGGGITNAANVARIDATSGGFGGSKGRKKSSDNSYRYMSFGHHPASVKISHRCQSKFVVSFVIRA
jgi:hypothetical protein